MRHDFANANRQDGELSLHLMRRSLALVALLLLSFTSACLPAQADQGRASTSGRVNHVDLAPRTVGWTYPSTGDVRTYGLVSPIPIAGIGKGIELAAIEGMRDVQMRLTITVENLGDITAIGANATVVVIHNEYVDFIIASMNQTLPDIAPNTNGSFTWDFTPTYSGTHTLRISIEHVNESKPADNVGTTNMRIGSYHTGFPNNAGWTLPGAGGWSFDSASGLYDPSTSIGSATCIAIGAGSSGSGQNPTGSYAPNLNTSAVSPPLDLPTPHPSPNELVGLAFIYSGMVVDTDHVVIEILGPNGAWHPISANLQATAGTQSWSITSTTVNGGSSNILPIDPAKIHEAMQMRFRFVSDSSGEDIGMYFDELVVLTEEKARFIEYGFTFDTISNSSSEPGEVALSTFHLLNTGNLTETFTPTVTGLPAEWKSSVHFADSGMMVPTAGITLAPNQEVNISVATEVPLNESAGSQTYQLTLGSQSYANMTTTRDAHLNILEVGRVEWASSSGRERCLSGTTCTYTATLLNPVNHSVTAHIEQMSFFPPSEWGLSTNPVLPHDIQIPSQGQIDILMDVTVPANSIEGQILEFQMGAKVAGAVTNATTFDLIVDRGAEAVGQIGHESGIFQEETIQLGGQTRIDLMVWNNGSAMSDFDLEPTIEAGHESSGWTIEARATGRVTIGSGMTHNVFFLIDAPGQGFAGSMSPSFGIILRSDDGTILSHVDDLKVTLAEHLSARVLTPEETIVATPLQSTEVHVLIENTGNINASAQFAWNIPDGWEHEGMQTGSVNLPGAYSDEQVRITLNLSPPLTANVHSLGMINFNLVLENQTILEDFEVIVGGVAGLVWGPDTDVVNEVSAPIGRATTVSARLTNMGNDVDNSSTARLSTSLENAPVRFFIGKVEASIEQWQDLEIKARDGINLIFDVWPSAEHLDETINVTLSIQSWNAASQRQEESSRTWTFLPQGAPIMSASFTGGIYNLLSPSGTRSYKVTLENTGTISGNVNINAALIGKANGWDVAPSQLTATVDPGDNLIVFINVTAPSIETSLMDLNITVLHDGSELGPFSVSGLTVIISTPSTTASASQSETSARLIDPIALAIILGGIGILMIGAFILLGRKGVQTTKKDEEEVGAPNSQTFHTQTAQTTPQGTLPQQVAQPAQGAYPTQGTYPTQGVYQAQGAYPTQSGYPIQSSNVTQTGYPAQATPTSQSSNAQTAAFAALGVSTEQATPTATEIHTASPMVSETIVETATAPDVTSSQTQGSGQVTEATPPQLTTPAPVEQTHTPTEFRCITCLTPITDQQSWVPCSSCGQYHHWACSQSQPICRYCHQAISSPAS